MAKNTPDLLQKLGSDFGGKPRGRYLCPCGKEFEARVDNVRSGNTVSCGCRTRTRDGLAGREKYTYISYKSMLERCYNSRHPRYADYGGRGVLVYFDWLGRDGFARFLAEVGRRPKGLTLDRIRVEDSYEPGNVRWATPKEQANNRRPPRRK